MRDLLFSEKHDWFPEDSAVPRNLDRMPEVPDRGKKCSDEAERP